MDITKAGPPEIRDVDVDCDVLFTLNKREVETLSNPVTQGMIAAQLAGAASPFGAAAA